MPRATSYVFLSIVSLHYAKPSSHTSQWCPFVFPGVVSGSNIYVKFCWEIRNGSCGLQLFPRLCVLTCFLVPAFACSLTTHYELDLFHNHVK